MLLVGTASATWLRFCKSCAVDDLRSALRDGPEALISSSLKAYAFGVLPVAALKASGAELNTGADCDEEKSQAAASAKVCVLRGGNLGADSEIGAAVRVYRGTESVACSVVSALQRQ